METNDSSNARLSLLERDLVRLETTVDLFVRESIELRRALIPKIDNLLESRSGEREEAKTMRRDIDDSIRRQDEMDNRLDRMDSRANKMYWMTVGGIGTLQFLFFAINWLMEHGHLFGGMIK